MAGAAEAAGSGGGALRIGGRLEPKGGTRWVAAACEPGLVGAGSGKPLGGGGGGGASFGRCPAWEPEELAVGGNWGGGGGGPACEPGVVPESVPVVAGGAGGGGGGGGG